MREICGGLASWEGKLAHLGIEAPSRTTLAYANAHRPWQLTETGVWFVTRMKDGTAYEVVRRQRIPARGGVVRDEWIVLRTPQSAAKYAPELPLRRVAIVTDGGERFVFLTNHLGLGPTTVARIYKDRRQIELLNDPFVGPPQAPAPIQGVLI